MKQSDITLGQLYHVKLRPYQTNEHDWAGLSPYKFGYGGETVMTVVAKGIERDRRKDGIAVTSEDKEGQFIVPARHIVESVEGRKIRLAQENYDRQHREAINENESFDKVDKVDKIVLGKFIENQEQNAKTVAAQLRRELNDLKEAVEKQINLLDESLDIRYHAAYLKDGVNKYPNLSDGLRGNRVITEAKNVTDTFTDYERATAIVNALIEAQKDKDATEEA